MATLVKEKRRDKKKSKDKRSKVDIIEKIESPSTSEEPPLQEINIPPPKIEEEILDVKVDTTDTPSKSVSKPKKIKIEKEPEVLICSLDTSNSEKCESPKVEDSETDVTKTDKEVLEATDAEFGFKDLATKLKNMAIPPTAMELTKKREKELEHTDAYLQAQSESTIEECEGPTSKSVIDDKEEAVADGMSPDTLEDVQPSAPLFVENKPKTKEPPKIQEAEVIQPLKPKVQCMPLQDAIKLFSGKEMAEIQAMSEKEEAIVEAGPVSGPEHPLVDLLSTFRSSLISLEREGNELTAKVREEERIRNALWKIEKRHVDLWEPCGCGGSVNFKATYDHAELLRDKLPAAKMKLEAMSRDIHESYCYHQHAAMLAHCQIDELVSETMKRSKEEIREALSLVLRALRTSDTAPAALAAALQRWASALADELVDARDLRQLLFLIHHLFRQTHSVKWAAQYVRLSAGDSAACARALAVLAILTARPKPLLDTSAVECTEDAEVWEEVDKHGGGGAVSEGNLRERDLLALLYAFPLRDLVARIMQFKHEDISKAQPWSWGGAAGAGGALRACCGVRAVLHALRRAAAAHRAYPRLRRALRRLAGAALTALANLHVSSREFYAQELRDKISGEMQACFVEGFALFGAEDLDSLPAALLTEDAAMDYCLTLGLTLHDKSPRGVNSLSIDLPELSCDMRIKMIACACIDRTDHPELARTMLDFLLTTCVKIKPVCKGECTSAARQYLPRVLRVHTYLYSAALHTLADMHHLSPVEPWVVPALSVGLWRPAGSELCSLLDDWAVRCEHLIQHLLLNLDYTPHTGVSLEAQLSLGAWLCSWTAGGEARWRVLRALRVHQQGAPAGPGAQHPPPDPPHHDLFATAHALLATSWGHCIPLICTEGVSALRRLCAARLRDAVHCAAPLMAVMAQSPESVSLTPQFAEVFSTLLSTNPTLVQRALGRGGASGSELLLRAILEQVDNEQCSPGLLRAWAHALWGTTIVNGASNSGQGLVVMDVVALATRDWPTLDAHAAELMEDDSHKLQVDLAVRMASCAPLVCSVTLHAWQAVSARRHHNPLLNALHHQRKREVKIHVDNALKQVDPALGSEELTVYRSAVSASAAPFHHPAHLMLWRLFMHLYLERPQESTDELEPPVGVLFFSGIMKSRQLAQVKKKLQEAATYHHNEAERIKTEQNALVKPKSTQINEKRSKTAEIVLFKPLTLVDLTGESIKDTDSDGEERKEVQSKDTSKDDSSTLKRKLNNLLSYHVGAEKMLREYYRWIEEGDKVRATQHHADIVRFICEQAMDEGWKVALARGRPPPIDLDSPTIAPAMLEPLTPEIPLRKAVDAILKIKDCSQKKSKAPVIKSFMDGINVHDSGALSCAVNDQLRDLQKVSEEWKIEVAQIATLNTKLWEHVSGLRVRRSLPPISKQCVNKCKPVVIMLPDQEWCISTGAENDVKENRNRWMVYIRDLTQVRPLAARNVAALHALVRRGVRDYATASQVAERLWRCTPNMETCVIARQALCDTMQVLAEKWISRDGQAVVELVSRWSRGEQSVSQLAHTGVLVAPRLLPPAHWPHVYITLVKARLPEHLLFSCLSKFEMSRWTETISPSDRRDILQAMPAALTRWLQQHPQGLLLELGGVHVAALLDAREYVTYVVRCTRAAQAQQLPAAHWDHVVAATERCAAELTFEQLTGLVRQLSTTWWATRMEPGTCWRSRPVPPHACAGALAGLFAQLTRALVRNMRALSFDPVRVARFGWGTMSEAWAAWVCPHSSEPLLPLAADCDHYSPMAARFVDSLLDIIADCPGSEVPLLQQVFAWCAEACGAALAGAGGAARAQAPVLLRALARLPWQRVQWCYGDTLQVAAQMGNAVQLLQSWCCAAWRYIRADTWMQHEDDVGEPSDVADVARLVRLLYLFTGNTMPHYPETIQEATRLPWWKLPDRALDQSLEFFFTTHSEAGTPFFELPQYTVTMHAACLRAYDAERCCVRARIAARATCVSRMARAAAVTAMLPHVTAFCTIMLQDIANIAPMIEDNEGEIEDLLSRAVAVMCIEPASDEALPVWLLWIREANPRLILAALTAIGTVTTLEYFAPLAEAAVVTHLNYPANGGWRSVWRRWCSCPWRGARALLQRGRLRAAYGAALVCEPPRQHRHQLAKDTLDALAALQTIDFVKYEVMMAVWICYILRTRLACGAGACAETCAALLVRWAEPPRRSLLSVVTLQPDNERPTLGHRLLCRLAQCTLNPCETTALAFQAACTAMGSAYNDLLTWGDSPPADRLPRLACRLYPSNTVYFEWELELFSEFSQ